MVKVIETNGKSSKDIEKEITKLSLNTETHVRQIVSISSISDNRIIVHVNSYEPAKW